MYRSMVCLGVIGGLGVGLAAQGPTAPPADEELRLAMSAGPPSVSQHADLYRMTEHGFERAFAGTNGWACLVVRSAADARIVAPHCLNPTAVETVLPALLRQGALLADGRDAEAIEAELLRQFASGELPLPSGPAYAYMASSGQYLGKAFGQFEPHFMLYVPYVTNADIGGDPTRPAFPFVAPRENHPLSTVNVVMDEFVDPATMTLPTRE